MSKPLVKVFGERNSGTRALHQMLQRSKHVQTRKPGPGTAEEQQKRAELSAQVDRHFAGAWRKIYRDALRDNERHVTDPVLTWKHAAPVWHDAFRREKVNVIFLVRNPYSWVLSMARRPYHMVGRRPVDLAEFITRPWMTQRRDNTAPLLSGVLDLWQTKVRAYKSFSTMAKANGLPTYFMRFEDFVAGPVAEASIALAHFGAVADDLRPSESHTKDEGRDLASIQSYYGQEKWRDRLCRETVALINERVDWDMAGRLGYRELDPTEFPPAPTLDDGDLFGEQETTVPILLDRETGTATAA